MIKELSHVFTIEFTYQTNIIKPRICFGVILSYFFLLSHKHEKKIVQNKLSVYKPTEQLERNVEIIADIIISHSIDKTKECKRFSVF